MARKGFKKQKSGAQKKKQRKPKPQGSGGGSATTSSSAGGTMGAFRRGLQVVAGTGKKKGPKTPLERAFDILLWLVVIAAGFYLFSEKCA
jgi:hypothetical protein